MVNENGDMYYKLGRTSSRKTRIASYAKEYNIKTSEVKFLYEVEVQNEKLAEKLVFNILEDYRIDKVRELFIVSFEIAKDVLNYVAFTIMKFKYNKISDLNQDNINTLMDFEEI